MSSQPQYLEPSGPARMDEQPTIDDFPLEEETGERHPAPAADRDYSDLFRPGEVLEGGYEVQRVLGSGGMGQVFEGHDRRLGRPVAIKASWPHVGPAPLRSEARALAGLQHPGLVTVHAMGQHRGIDYLVMERLYGLTLEDHLRQRRGESPFSLEEMLDAVIGVADALAVMHRAGLVHRDLKPGNIMLAPGHRMVLMDLGVSQSQREAGAEERVYGSPHYIAPEAATATVREGKAHLVDIYALGIICFEMLIGRPPFRADEPMKLLRMHVAEIPPRVASLRDDIPVHLDRLISEMLAKDPDRRPQSVEVVAAWLRAIRRGHCAPDQPKENLRVLIADDDPDMRALLEACVDEAVPGAEVEMASDGDEALALFRRKPPDVMLLDLRMPGMSGLELCMYLRGTTLAQNTSIVAVSAHASARDRNLLEQLGIVDFVSKQTSSQQLLVDLLQLLRGIEHTRTRILR